MDRLARIDAASSPSAEAIVPTIHQVILKVASKCNLNCTYCYVYNAKDKTYLGRPPQLSEALARTALAHMKAYSSKRPPHRMSVCLHGGEPLLLGKNKFRDLIGLIRSQLGQHLGSLSVQTNAVLIDRDWARLLRELQISVSVSLDGAPDVNDSERVDHRGRGSHARAVSGIQHLLREGMQISVLCVVRPGASGFDTYKHLRSIGITDFDFLLPDISHDDWGDRFGASGGTPVADFLIPALEAWLAEDNPDITIRFFSDIFKLILGDVGSTDAFGGGAMPYIVIETDGTIQANDALRVCEESLGETGLDIVRHDLDDLPRARPVARDLIAGAIPKPEACQACPEFRTCGGGYLPHRYSRERGFDNPSVWCADILKLFGHMRSVVAASQPPLVKEFSQ
jgi:uncharacterized protein